MSEIVRHPELTELILRAFYQVYNRLGYGFLEKVKVYDNSRKLPGHGPTQINTDI